MGDSSGAVIITEGGGKQAVKNIVDAASEMQRYWLMESKGADSNSNMFAWDQTIEFFMIGFKIFLPGFFLALFLLPIAVAVNFGYINMFAGLPNLFDKIFIFVIVFSMTLTALFILMQLRKYVFGAVTYKMLKSLYQGALLSGAIKGILLFIIFMLITSLLTPSFLISHTDTILWLFPEEGASMKSDINFWITQFLAKIQPIFRLSAFVMLIFTALNSLMLLMALYGGYKEWKYNQAVKDYMDSGQDILED